MIVVGVTGGIGSGKSTVASLLAERGARVLDADRIVHALYSGGDLPRRIEARLGPGLLDAEGAIDRAVLARVAFEEPGAREELERLVHPEVRRSILTQLEGWRDEGFPGVVVIDAALLVEADSPYPLDALVVVTAPEALRLERLAARGVPEDEARRRIAAQATDERKVEHADHVLDNSGSAAELASAVDALLRELGHSPERAGPGGDGPGELPRPEASQ